MKTFLLVLLWISLYLTTVKTFTSLWWKYYEKENKGKLITQFLFPTSYDSDDFGEVNGAFPAMVKYCKSSQSDKNEYLFANVFTFPLKVIPILLWFPYFLLSAVVRLVTAKPIPIAETPNDKLIRIMSEKEMLEEEIDSLEKTLGVGTTSTAYRNKGK